MHHRLTQGLLALTIVLGAGVSVTAQQPAGFNFNVYVALGDSLTAGVVSASLVQTRQAHSYPAQIALQAGIQGFQQPLISEPGLPAELTLRSLSPVLILPRAGTPGVPTNLGLARPYNNMGVPGAVSVDLLTRRTDAGGIFDVILRNRGTAVEQAVGLRPTFLTLWIGSNDVLGAAIRGRAIDGVTLTPAATFRVAYQQIVSALRTTGARIVAANIPDVTSIPFVTTIPPFVVNPTNNQQVPLLGPAGPLPPGSFVTLPAASLLAEGVGIPAPLGRGTPLPDEVILDPAEVATIRARVEANNQAIADICQAAGIPLLNVNRIFREFATTGRSVGGVRLSTVFLTGGVFSYDGVHPTELGYAILANEFIGVINANGGNLRPVNLAPLMGLGFSGSTRTTPTFEFTREAYENLLASFPTVDGR